MSSLSYEYNDPNDTRPSHIYYDLIAVNNDISGTLDATPVTFSETRGSPFLTNPQDYFCSIVRMQVETPYLPLYIVHVQTGQNDVNLTIYSVSLSYQYNGTTYVQETYLRWIPENLSVPLPAIPTIRQDYTTEYYWGMSYQKFATMINVALQSCYTDLNTQVVTAGGTLPSLNAPFFSYNDSTFKFTLNADTTGYDVNSGNYISIFADDCLGVLLSAFDVIFYGNNQRVTNGRNYQYRVYNQQGNNTFIGTVSPYNYTMYQMSQSYPTTPLFCPIKSVSFQSATLPIQADLLGKPAIFSGNNGAITGGNNNGFAPILTDVLANVQNGYEYKPNLIYSPAVYRLLHMFGNQSLNNIDLQIYWTDMMGNDHIVKLLPQRSAQIKIMFRLKSYGV